MFDHTKDTVSEAIGIPEEVLKEEWKNTLAICAENFPFELNRAIPELEKKPKVILSYLLTTAKNTVGTLLLEGKWSDQELLLSIAPLFYGTGFDRKSEEVESWTNLPSTHLAYIVVNLMVMLMLVTGVISKDQPLLN